MSRNWHITVTDPPASGPRHRISLSTADGPSSFRKSRAVRPKTDHFILYLAKFHHSFISFIFTCILYYQVCSEWSLENLMKHLIIFVRKFYSGFFSLYSFFMSYIFIILSCIALCQDPSSWIWNWGKTFILNSVTTLAFVTPLTTVQYLRCPPLVCVQARWVN